MISIIVVYKQNKVLASMKYQQTTDPKVTQEHLVELSIVMDWI